MGRKRKKENPSIEKKKNGPPLPLPVTATSEEEEKFHRNWSELPELALHSIFRRLVSIPDFLSFSSVCRSWNSLSTTSSSSTSFPPLLLLPVTNLRNPNPNFSLRARRSTTWSHPPRCRLQTLETLGRSFHSKIPSRTLALPFLGYSNGHLIFNLSTTRTTTTSSSSPFLLLANVFSGQTTRIPFLIPSLFSFPHIALLTDTDLLLASNSLILSYHRATASWSHLNHGAASLALSRHSNHLFSIDRDATNLRLIEFAPASDAAAASPGIRSKPMLVPSPPLSGPFILCNDFAHRLVVCCSASSSCLEDRRFQTGPGEVGVGGSGGTWGLVSVCRHRGQVRHGVPRAREVGQKEQLRVRDRARMRQLGAGPGRRRSAVYHDHLRPDYDDGAVAFPCLGLP